MTGQIWNVKSDRTDMVVRTDYRLVVEDIAPPSVLIDKARERLGLTDPGWSELAVAIGLEPSQDRKIRRWYSEENEASYRGTIMFLSLAGFLTPEAQRLLLARSSKDEAVDALRRISQRVPSAKKRARAAARDQGEPGTSR